MNMYKTTAMLIAILFLGTAVSTVAFAVSMEIGNKNITDGILGEIPGSGNEILQNNFPGGEGSEADPFLIETVEQLQAMNDGLEAHYALAGDIDASETVGWNDGAGFVPVGPFAGSLDGRGHTITGLYINRPNTDYVGLFGYIDMGGEVRNVGVVDADVSGNSYVGGLIGWNSGSVTDSYATGNTTGTSRVGGLIGSQGPDGAVNNSHAAGSVIGAGSWVGGLVGRSIAGTVNNSYATTTVGGHNYAGGFIGQSSGTIFNSYATGNVTRNPGSTGSNFGGFIGHNHRNKVINCYSTGAVYESPGTIWAAGNKGFAGGVDTTENYEMTGNFWDMDTSGQTSTAGAATGKTTTNMMAQATFTGASWNFVDTWWMVDGQTRPFLRMEWSTEIRNSHQLQLMEMNLAADYVLAGDVDLSDIIDPAQMWGTSPTQGAGFVPVGDFEGSLDGQGHIITGLYINLPVEWNVGLFNVADIGTRLSNISLRDVNITGFGNVGALAGFNQGNVSNSHASGVVRGEDNIGGLIGNNWGAGRVYGSSSSSFVDGDSAVGGLVGFCDWGNVSNSHASGNVSGGNNVGGLIGFNMEATISNSHAGGNVAGDEHIGGLVGFSTGVVEYSHATGNVYGDIAVGGLVGQNDGVIHDSYATGNVLDLCCVGGGLVGSNRGYVLNSYATGNVSGDSDVGGLVGRIAEGYVNSSYALGNVFNVSEFSSNIGGLVGENWRGFVHDSYAVGEVTGYSSVGGLVGNNNGGLVNNSHATGALSGDSEVGGLVGYNTGTVNNSHAIGNIFGDRVLGGLVGENDADGVVEGSHASGSVDGDSDHVGGLIGRNFGVVNNSHSEGNVAGFSEVGGLVGSNRNIVNNSYSTGDVTGTEIVGGLVGDNSDTIINSHYNVETVLINNGHHVTPGGLYHDQYQDWVSDLSLDIDEYNSLVQSGDYYDIGSVQGLKDMLGFAYLGDYNFRLVEDIDVSTVPGLCIPHLAGNFEGNNHTISNVHVDQPFASKVGMFGYLQGGDVKNLNLLDVDVTGFERVGGLVGLNDDGNITNCHVTGTVFGLYLETGGLVGRNSADGIVSYSSTHVDLYAVDNQAGGLVGNNRGLVNNSYAVGNITAGGQCGGLVGSNDGIVNNSYATGFVYGTDSVKGISGGTGGNVGGLIGRNFASVSNSYATGDVVGMQDYVGGLVGPNSGTLEHIYALGSVSGANYVGGLVGANQINGEISESYSTGPVHGEADVGGLIGSNTGTVESSFWDTETSGMATSAGGPGVEGKTTEEMMTQLTFTGAGWNLFSSWLMEDGETRPFLSMEWSREIRNSHQLQLMASAPYGDYVLMEDIVLSDILEPNRMWGTSPDAGAGFFPVGIGWPDGFEGIFDGQGHTISGLYINRSASDYIGLFGVLGGAVSNVSLVDVNITGDVFVGGLVGNNNGLVNNSHVSGVVNANTRWTGGITGQNYGILTNSSFTGNVTGGMDVGGLVGSNVGGGIINTSYAVGAVTGTVSRIGGLAGNNHDGIISESYAVVNVIGTINVGGLAGLNDVDGDVQNSYAHGMVSGDDNVGGLVGNNAGTISNSYSVGFVSGETDVGGLVGLETGSTDNSFWDNQTSNQTISAGGTGKNTADMKTEYTFTNTTTDGLDESWDFVDIWHVVEGITYPLLWWQDVSTPPVANAGGDRTVGQGTTVQFDGSGSTSSFGFQSFQWTFYYDGSQRTRSGMEATFIFNIPGTYTVTLTVTDNIGNSDTDTMRVTVLDTEDPEADAGGDQTVFQGTTVTLDGSGSTDNVGIVSYTWTFNDGVEDVELSGEVVTHLFTVPGTYTVTLEVEDAADNTGSDTMTVTVEADTEPPEAVAGDDRTVDQGTTVTLDGSSSTDNVGIVSYTWTFEDDGLVTLDGEVVTYQFNNPGVFLVTINVSDAADNWATDTLTVTVNDTENPTANAGSDETVELGDDIVLDGSGSTDNVRIVNYTWTFKDGVENITLYGETATYTFQSTGTFTVTLNVSDAAGNWATDSATITVEDTTPPTIVSWSPTGTSVSIDSPITVEFSEPVVKSSAEAGFSIDPHVDGTITWDEDAMAFTPSTNLEYETEYTVTIVSTVEDLAGNTMASAYTWKFTTEDAPEPTGTISGRIVNEDGNSVVGAEVVVEGTDRTTITDSQGNFILEDVPLGSQTIVVKVDGVDILEFDLDVEEGENDVGEKTIVPAGVAEDPSSGMWLLLVLVIAAVSIVALVFLRKKPAAQPPPPAPPGGQWTPTPPPGAAEGEMPPKPEEPASPGSEPVEGGEHPPAETGPGEEVVQDASYETEAKQQ